VAENTLTVSTMSALSLEKTMITKIEVEKETRGVDVGVARKPPLTDQVHSKEKPLKPSRKEEKKSHKNTLVSYS